MAEAEISLPRLKTALSQIKPKLDADKTIHFRVVNDLQKSWIEKNCKTRLLAFLRDKLDNRFIELVVEVESAEETKETKLYMPEEKAKFLLENYPEMRELQKDLKLELK
jgi:chromosomal replication initiation ATPase DnaA